MDEEDQPNHEDQAEAVRRVFDHIFRDWDNIDANGRARLQIFGMRSVVMARVMFPDMFDHASMRTMAKRLGVSQVAFMRNVKRLEKRIGVGVHFAFSQTKSR